MRSDLTWPPMPSCPEMVFDAVDHEMRCSGECAALCIENIKELAPILGFSEIQFGRIKKPREHARQGHKVFKSQLSHKAQDALNEKCKEPFDKEQWKDLKAEEIKDEGERGREGNECGSPEAHQGKEDKSRRESRVS